MNEDAIGYEAFTHIRILVGMVTGLSVTRLLSGLARFVQHPGRVAAYPAHIGWAVFMLLAVVHFWWFEFGLAGISFWSFKRYVFVLCFAALHFFISAVLFPDTLEEYDGYRAYFLARRRWLFLLLAGLLAFDTADTVLKGADHLLLLGNGYWIRQSVLGGICLLGALTPRFQGVLVGAAIVNQLVWIAWRYQYLS